jgi:5-(carboxyamino)imidazole ribonucleotide synthase
MRAFAADCAVVTYEFENVPVAPLSALAPTPLLAHPRALETAQDRVNEKTFVKELGGRPAPLPW